MLLDQKLYKSLAFADDSFIQGSPLRTEAFRQNNITTMEIHEIGTFQLRK